MMLEKKEKARQATKAWKKENVQQEKVVQQLYYQIHKPEILESRKLQSEEEKELCAAAGLAGVGGSAAAYTFAVLPGCKLECYPGACKACFNSKDRHAVWVRIRSAYEIEAQEEVPLPIDSAGEEELVAGLELFWCRHDCCDYLKTREKCRYFGTCQRCSTVNRREKSARCRAEACDRLVIRGASERGEGRQGEGADRVGALAGLWRTLQAASDARHSSRSWWS